MQFPSTRHGSLLKLLVILAATLLASSAWAENTELERLIRKDGTSVVGVIVGFGQGAYRVRVGEGTVEVPAHDVRTIEAAGDSPTARETIKESAPRGWVEEVAEALAVRSSTAIDAQSRRLHADSLAALLRGEWDFALRGTKSVSKAEPNWVDPQILALVVQTETGRESEALRLALRVTSEHPNDLLAGRVAAEVFRRGGFPHRAAELEESVLLASGGLADRRDLARLWWPLDRARAQGHWQELLSSDPRLDRASFPEAVLLRKSKAAIALGDLVVAGQAIEEVARNYPWAEAEVRLARIALTEARLRQAELGGDLALATLAAETLERLGAKPRTDLTSRLAQLREKGITNALKGSDADELQKWFRAHAHLIEGSAGSDASVASRMQELGLDALLRGDLVDARSGLALSQQIDPTAESPRAAAQVVALVNHAIQELSRRHEERAFSVLSTLHSYLPQRDRVAVTRLAEFFDRPKHDFLTEAERRGLAGRLASMYGEAGVVLGATPLPAVSPRAKPAAKTHVAPIKIDAVAAIAKWFPIAVGSQWTYRLDNGMLEEREIVQSGADGKGGWLVVIRVSPQSRSEYETRAWIREGELILGSPVAPPGEVLIRGGLAVGDHWEWSRGNFRFTREVEDARYPVETPVGVFHDVRVLRAENTLDSQEGGRTWSASHRITFAEGVGVVRIDGASETVDRELIEFRPGEGAAEIQPALGDATKKQG